MHHPAWIDVNSDITVSYTISQFTKSDSETPYEFASSEPSPSTFSQLPFRRIHSQAQSESPSTLSQATPNYSPFTNERSDNNSPDPQITHKYHMY